MQESHVEDPGEVGKALNAISPGVVNQSKAMREVPCIAHRDHLVVKEGEVPYTCVDEARSVDEGASPEDVARDDRGKREARSVCRSAWLYSRALFQRSPILRGC